METRLRFLADVLNTAVEGGISYWAMVTRWNPYDATATIYEIEEEERKYFKLNYKLIDKAIKQMVDDKQSNLDNEVEGILLYANKYNDAGNIDGELADMIIQTACFQEVKYG
jgi:hypothetical protein